MSHLLDTNGGENIGANDLYVSTRVEAAEGEDAVVDEAAEDLRTTR